MGSRYEMQEYEGAGEGGNQPLRRGYGEENPHGLTPLGQWREIPGELIPLAERQQEHHPPQIYVPPPVQIPVHGGGYQQPYAGGYGGGYYGPGGYYVAGGYSGGDDRFGTNIDIRNHGTITINGVKYTGAAGEKTLAWVK